jgi:hypothetical protein
MENNWGIKISRIALPEKKLTEQEWFNKLKVSSNFRRNTTDNSYSLNNQYNFSKLKTNKNESTNNGA